MSGLIVGVEAVPRKFEQVTVGTSASLLTTLSSRPTDARSVILYPEDEIRFRCDGTSPTQAIGIILDAKFHMFENQGQLLDDMEVISATGSNVTLNVHWFR